MSRAGANAMKARMEAERVAADNARAVARAAKWAETGITAALAEGLPEKGGRNNALNGVAYRVGRLLHLADERWGDDSGGEALTALIDLGTSAGLKTAASKATARSGLKSGLKKPHEGPCDGASVVRPATHRRKPVMTDSKSGPSGQAETAEYADFARKLIDAGRAIAAYPDHPARRWAASGHAAAPLWPEHLPFPPGWKWLPKDDWAERWKTDEAAGSIMAPFWNTDAKKLVGLQLVHVQEDGTPALDSDGLGKRTMKILELHGVPGVKPPGVGDFPVAFVEGLADALAVASKVQVRAVLAKTNSAWGDELGDMALKWVLANGGQALVFADGSVDARESAVAFVERLVRGGAGAVVIPSALGQDPASTLQGAPFRFQAPVPRKNAKAPERPLQAPEKAAPKRKRASGIPSPHRYCKKTHEIAIDGLHDDPDFAGHVDRIVMERAEKGSPLNRDLARKDLPTLYAVLHVEAADQVETAPKPFSKAFTDDVRRVAEAFDCDIIAPDGSVESVNEWAERH